MDLQYLPLNIRFTIYTSKYMFKGIESYYISQEVAYSSIKVSKSKMAVNTANNFCQSIVHVTLSTILKTWYHNMP